MAKIVSSHLVSSISGKLCKKDTTYIGVNKRTGKMYSAGYHGCVQPNSEKQQTVKSSFTKKSQFASFWWKQNRPSATSAKGTEAYLAVMKAYKAQHKIGNPYSFMRSLVTDDLKVMLAGNDLTGGVKPGGSDSRLCIARIAYWIEQISDVAIQFLAKVLQTFYCRVAFDVILNDVLRL